MKRSTQDVFYWTVMVMIVLALVVGLVLAFMPEPAHAAILTITTSSVDLSWSSPGDDGAVGTATVYDLRYSLTPITTANFSTATRWTNTPVPLVSGTTQGVTVNGLAPGTVYYFAIKAADEAGNWSVMSNVATATTLGLPDLAPPSAVTDLRPVAP